MKRPKPAVTQAVNALEGMTLKQVREEWQRRYGNPPKHRAADLMRRVLAWRIQVDAYGGFDAATKKMVGGKAAPLKVPVASGIRLARDWAGMRHEVVITDGGVIYADKIYNSLSAVARHITGKRWNGPKFFGLRD